MESFGNVIDYLFGIYISDRDGLLVIEDRRPTAGMFVSIAGMAGIALFLLISAALSLIGLGFDLWSGIGAFAGLIALFVVMFLFSLGGTFREVYTFDMATDTYRFTRRGIFNNDVIEGSAGQFSGVRIDKRRADDDNAYMVTLLLDGMLLGQPGTQILRDDPPIFNSHGKEVLIASAISKFLSIKFVDDSSL
ncbi:MAG: hypothetical protein K1X36_14700 [Pyrinomonadaceae bacterium]|nr:hypothetical protein [Pyrinomonadaceae bacterium]